MMLEVVGTISKQKPPRKMESKAGGFVYQTNIIVKDSSEAGAVMVTGYLDAAYEPGSTVRVLLDIPTDGARPLAVLPDKGK